MVIALLLAVVWFCYSVRNLSSLYCTVKIIGHASLIIGLCQGFDRLGVLYVVLRKYWWHSNKHMLSAVCLDRSAHPVEHICRLRALAVFHLSRSIITLLGSRSINLSISLIKRRRVNSYAFFSKKVADPRTTLLS